MSPRRTPAPAPRLVPVEGEPRPVLEACAAQLRSMIGAADAGDGLPDERDRPRRRFLEAQLELVLGALEALPE